MKWWLPSLASPSRFATCVRPLCQHRGWMEIVFPVPPSSIPSRHVLCCVWHYNPLPSLPPRHPSNRFHLPPRSPLSSLPCFPSLRSIPLLLPSRILQRCSRRPPAMPLCFQVKYVSPKSEVAHPQRSQKRQLALLLLSKNFPSSYHLSERGKTRHPDSSNNSLFPIEL